MRRKKEAVLSFEWNNDDLPKIVRECRDKYKEISRILDENPEILDLVHEDLKRLSGGGRVPCPRLSWACGSPRLHGTAISHRKQCKRYDVPGDAHFLTFSCFRRLPLLGRDRSRNWLIDAIELGRTKSCFGPVGYGARLKCYSLTVSIRPIRS